MSCLDDRRQRVMRVSAERKEPVLLHIQDAESWLSRARAAYRAANDIRGELDLSLAQAEVRYAWELSRGEQEALTVLPVVKRPAARWMLPLAACLGLGLLAAIFLPRLAGRPAEGPVAVRPRPAAAAPRRSASVPKASPRQKPPVTFDEPTAVPPTILEQPHEEALPVPSVSPAPTMPAAVEPEVPSRPVVPPAENARPASAESGMALDLDELARMAQETLTSGESVSGGQH